MMFDPANSVRQQLLTRPKAEMCFRPWWDTVEDYVLITMLGLGQKINGEINASGQQVFVVETDLRRRLPIKAN